MSTQEISSGVDETPIEKKVEPHYHLDNKGVLHTCYHQCRRLVTDSAFWIGLTISFPFEHVLWEKVWPFYLLTEWMDDIQKIDPTKWLF